jgi:transposase
VSGRKRQVLVDTLGLLLGVVVHPADESDSYGGRAVLAETVPWHERLAVVWADQTYRGSLVAWARDALDLDLSIVHRPAEQRGFVPQPKRWTVEHTFRCAKQTLNWTTPRVRHPEQADRWTWLVLLAYTELRLARSVVADQRLPWEAAQHGRRAGLTPTRVR